LIIALLLISQHKIIDWLTKQISKHESLVNNNKEVKRSKEQKQEELGRENKHDYIRKNERIHYIDIIIRNVDYTMIYEFPIC
jgi:hypothetical protein